MKETWGAWFYRRPTNPPNHEREWLGGIDSIEIVNLKIPWGLWFYRCIFRKRVRASRIITIKLSTPTLSLNSKGDTYSMYTLLIKWGCTPSKESNIVLVWCDSSPYHTLDFFWSQDLRETCAKAAGRISRLRPDFAFFFQSCAPLKTAVAGFETGYWFFHVLFIPAWDEDFMWRSRDGLKHVEARRWLKADLHQHTTCASWSRFPGASIPGRSADIWRCQPLERSAMKSSGCDHHVIQRWCWYYRTDTGVFVSSFHNKYEATQDIFLELIGVKAQTFIKLALRHAC